MLELMLAALAALMSCRLAELRLAVVMIDCVRTTQRNDKHWS